MDSYDPNIREQPRRLERYNNGHRMEGRNQQMGAGPMPHQQERRFEEPYRPGDRNLMGEDYHYGPRYLSGGKLERFSVEPGTCLLYTSPSPRDQRGSRMPSSA